MSKAERKLPQYCYCHPRNDYHSFRPEEGKFIANNTKFICNGCLEGRRRSRLVTAANRTSPLEGEALHTLLAAGYKFEYQYDIGRYHFDLGFPRQRLLIELDGKRWHQSRRARARDACKSAFAESHGWRVVHISNGPGLARRIMDLDAIRVKDMADDGRPAEQAQIPNTVGTSADEEAVL
jgi:very-short-patch-repair endonuclease